MAEIDLLKLENWCQDALTLLPTPELPASFVEQRRATIRRHSGTKLMHKIAEDLAEGISELPLDARNAANEMLQKKYGFGYELFTDRKLKQLSAVFRKGKIANDDEFRELSALASDVEINAELRSLVEKLLFDYETRVEQTKSTLVAIRKKKPSH